MHYQRTLLLLLIATLLASCGIGAQLAPAAQQFDANHPLPSASITVVDARGREVTLDAPPSRIVVAGRATALIAHSLYMFPETRERLAALEDRSQRGLQFYSLVDPEFENKVLLEREAGPEQILPVEPDLVLLKTYMAETLGDPLERLGIPVVYVDLETPEQFHRDVALLGRVLNSTERADTILAYYDSQLERIRGLLDSAAGDPEPRVLMLQYSLKGGDVSFFVPAASWLQTRLVQLAGGQPVWIDAAQGGGWTIVGFEQIAAWDADQIFVIYYPGDPGPIVDALLQDEKWQALGAAKRGMIHPFPGDFISWDQPDPRWVLGYLCMAKALHPEVVKEINLSQETADFYHAMFGIDRGTIDTHIIPLLHFED
jgi:iron complex transport system substrate-binding protein